MMDFQSFPVIDRVITAIFLFLAFVLPVMQILHRAGYSRWWILAALVPGVNLILFWVFAFVGWPIEEELESLKKAARPQAAATP